MADPKTEANQAAQGAEMFDAGNGILDTLIAQQPAPSVQNADLYRTQTDSQETVKSTNLQNVFEQAYPELAFTVTGSGENFRIISKPREQTNVPAKVTVPKGFSAEVTAKGIADLQAALEAAKTPDEKLEIAFRLNALVQTQKAYNFEQYKQRAENEFGVPDLLNSIEMVKRAEMSSRFNPGNGMPSKERLELIQSLGVARTHAAQRVKDLNANDPTLASAENLAQATISMIEAQHRLEGRKSTIAMRDERKESREAAIASLDPNFVQGISILRFNNGNPSSEQRRQIAESYVDRKLGLSKSEEVLAAASVDSLQGLYTSLKDPKEKEQAFRLLSQKEAEVVGDAKQADNNMKLFKAVFAKDPMNLPDAADISRRYKIAISEITARTAGMGNKERDAVVAETRLAYQREYLGRIVERAFQGDVRTWNGLMYADETAKAVLMSQKTNKDPITMNAFIDQYLAYNDGKKVQEKSQSLQAIISSAYEALPRSLVLPIPSKESVILDAQHKVARATFKLDPTYKAGGFNLNDF